MSNTIVEVKMIAVSHQIDLQRKRLNEIESKMKQSGAIMPLPVFRSYQREIRDIRTLIVRLSNEYNTLNALILK